MSLLTACTLLLAVVPSVIATPSKLSPTWVTSRRSVKPTSSALPDVYHSPSNRQGWAPGYDINTDYEKDVPPGKLVEYEFTIGQVVKAPDGYSELAMVANGEFPGPMLEANWGDTLRITVHNNMTNYNGSAIHWHGLRQYQTNWLDGVPGVTQCPGKPGDSQVYEFRLWQYGTSWWHSHFSLQYTNGLYGGIWIHGPSSANYDVDLGPFLISDWYHGDAFELYPVEILTPEAPLPAANLLNGKAAYTCTPGFYENCTATNDPYSVTVQKGKTYKIGLVNSGSLLTYKFYIDGHKFLVIQNDFVPIKPFEADVIQIGIGQRYEIVFKADADTSNGTNFWMHASYCATDTWESRLGVIRYDAKDLSAPADPPVSEQHYKFGCNDPDPKKLVPIVKRQVGARVNGNDSAEWLRIGLQGWPNVSDPINSRIKKWVLGNTTLQLDWEQPSLKKMTIDNVPLTTSFTNETVPVYLDYEDDEWVYFVITNNYTLDTANQPQTNPPSVHPIHLHGHDFVILAQGEGEFTTDIVPQLDNPARRDVADVTVGGYLWIAFQVNNPGAWLLHCHIAWHASAGLALQYVEQPSKIKPLMEKANALGQLKDRCDDWSAFYQNVSIPAKAVIEDSGI